MTTQEHSTRRRRFATSGVRYGVAVVVTLVVNIVLVLFLVAWRQRDRQAAPELMATVPLQVVDTQLDEPPPDTPDPMDEPAPTEPPEEPPLPEPPPPQIAVTEPPLDAPQPPPIEIALTHTSDVPLFAAEVVVAPPAPPPPPPPKPMPRPKPRPRPRPAPKPRPKPKPKPAPPVKRGVSRKPTLVEPPDLSAYYPRRARMRGTTGQSTIQLTVLADGTVADVQVLRSTPPGTFDRAAIRTGRVLRFRPALKDDRPVAASVTIDLVWQLEGEE